MPRSIPVFSSAVAGQTYILRPGSYGIIRNGVGAIAVVRVPYGVFLLGGGQKSEKSVEAALIREVAEECGLATRYGSMSERWSLKELSSACPLHVRVASERERRVQR